MRSISITVFFLASAIGLAHAQQNAVPAQPSGSPAPVATAQPVAPAKCDNDDYACKYLKNPGTIGSKKGTNATGNTPAILMKQE